MRHGLGLQLDESGGGRREGCTGLRAVEDLDTLLDAGELLSAQARALGPLTSLDLAPVLGLLEELLVRAHLGISVVAVGLGVREGLGLVSLIVGLLFESGLQGRLLGFFWSP